MVVLEGGGSGSLASLGFVLHAPVEKGRRRSTGSKVVQTDKETE